MRVSVLRILLAGLLFGPLQHLEDGLQRIGIGLGNEAQADKQPEGQGIHQHVGQEDCQKQGQQVLFTVLWLQVL